MLRITYAIIDIEDNGTTLRARLCSLEAPLATIDAASDSAVLFLILSQLGIPRVEVGHKSWGHPLVMSFADRFNA